MSIERPLAWLVFALGVATLIATSPPRWQATRRAHALVESRGEGDDQRVRLRLVLGRRLVRSAEGLRVDLEGVSSRPASDVRYRWLVDDAAGGEASDAGYASAPLPLDAGALRDASAGAEPADADRDASPGLPSEQTQYGDGFTRLFTSIDPALTQCGESDPCVLVMDVLLTADAPSPYELNLTAEADLFGDGDDRPKGAFEVSLEIMHAP